MNNRKGTIGEILTQFPSIIFLLLVILAYILVSTFILRDNIESYSLADDFLDDYVLYEGKVLTVQQMLSGFCGMNIFAREEFISKINFTLNEHFESKYGSGSYFAFVRKIQWTRIYSSNFDLKEYEIDENGELSLTGDNGSTKFYSFFDTKLSNVDRRRICTDESLFTREGR
ncbi:MAG: hypothetical protein FJZ43_03710 [Candidatus Staskawiczbacteria bacterium]|nr:hypothetical protein [Candidatus Staskawiczbacteria bacterium]